ncbi:MAG: GntR family transcriptional regulator [Ilumatobacteraceae bacterium]
MSDVTDRLRCEILSGEFPPGTRLIELQLTERYSVGRATIRATIVELSAEGLVVHEANRGATVRTVPIQVAIEIAQARAALEGLQARQAAARASEAERAELQAIIRDMEAAVDENDHPAYSELNGMLHRRIGQISGHSIGTELVANLRNRGAHQEFRLALKPGRSSISLPQHRAVVDGIVAGDGDAAEAAMRDHLASVESALRDWMS